ncbi:SMP-30/gluconolactonase/LRE family protein [Saccharospirillum alexandrii]|uniref:SMP-30/gluconolactonase/LRE family protein n=1 Tax=Saccharospirillum alexandrii TaxID=2448477 RepID=UPI003734D9B5
MPFAASIPLPDTSRDSCESLRCLVRLNNVIGESPVWCADRQHLVWADIEQQRVYQLDIPSNHLTEFPVDIGITALVPTSSGDWIAASRTGLYRLTPDFQTAYLLLDPEADRPGIRLNDAIADRQGRLWTGSLCDDRLDAPVGRLFRLDPDLRCTQSDAGFAVANGLCTSPDNRTLYAVDMFNHSIRQYTHDPVTGELGPARVFVQLAEHEGKPDGLCCDAEGGIWVCHWGGGCVSRFDARGQLSYRLQLPVSQPTRCTFGGPDLRDLFICSARFGLPEAALDNEPLAGSVFTVRVPWTGLPEPAFEAGKLPS